MQAPKMSTLSYIYLHVSCTASTSHNHPFPDAQHHTPCEAPHMPELLGYGDTGLHQMSSSTSWPISILHQMWLSLPLSSTVHFSMRDLSSMCTSFCKSCSTETAFVIPLWGEADYFPLTAFHICTGYACKFLRQPKLWKSAPGYRHFYSIMPALS